MSQKLSLHTGVSLVRLWRKRQVRTNPYLDDKSCLCAMGTSAFSATAGAQMSRVAGTVTTAFNVSYATVKGISQSPWFRVVELDGTVFV
jgi:hypothetical protein